MKKKIIKKNQKNTAAFIKPYQLIIQQERNIKTKNTFTNFKMTKIQHLKLKHKNSQLIIIISILDIFNVKTKYFLNKKFINKPYFLRYIDIINMVNKKKKEMKQTI